MGQEQSIYRNETIEHISSPEQLTDYLHVTNPGIWVILAAVIFLLVGVFVWSIVGTLETTVKTTVVVENHHARVIPARAEELLAGMPLRIAGQEYVIAAAEPDEYGRSFGIAEIALPDGIYDGTVVVERTRPIDFLLTSR